MKTILMAIIVASTLCAQDTSTPSTPDVLCPIAHRISNKAVTYELNGGRFGDNLISFAQALWVAYKYKIPLFYTPFTHSNKLELSSIFPVFEKESKANYANVVYVTKETTFDHKESTLYICQWHSKVKVGWNTPSFRALLKLYVAPKLLTIPTLSTNSISIAVHIRTGGKYDSQSQKEKKPHLFPPLDYYITFMKHAISLYPNRPITFYIFTDSVKPEELRATLQKKVRANNVSIVLSGKPRRDPVLTDFFLMARCEGIIRAASHFSLFAEYIGSHTLIMKPDYTYVVGANGHINHLIVLQKKNGIWQKTILPAVLSKTVAYSA
jgi:hypothetical protein